MVSLSLVLERHLPGSSPGTDTGLCNSCCSLLPKSLAAERKTFALLMIAKLSFQLCPTFSCDKIQNYEMHRDFLFLLSTCIKIRPAVELC